MKPLSIILTVLLLTGTASMAQLSKMQYEEAEQAFSEGKYEEAIKLVNESEKSNKGTNPFIMHLRIMARTELIKKDPEKDYSIIEAARNEIKVFLDKYSGDQQLEDKYRDVYNAYKVVKDLPENRELFEERIRQKREAIAKAKKEKEEGRQQFLAYTLFKEIKIGESENDFLKRYNIKRKNVLTVNDHKEVTWDKANVRLKYDKVYGYATTLEKVAHDNNNFEAGKAAANKLVKHYTALFGFEPSSHKYSNSEDFTWTIGRKTLKLRRVSFKMENPINYITHIDFEHEEGL